MPDSLFAFMLKMLAAVVAEMAADGDGPLLAALILSCAAAWLVALHMFSAFSRLQAGPKVTSLTS